MSWFGKKKEKKEEKPIEQQPVEKVEVKGDTPDNLIYKGPMSGMKEALDKWNKENK